MFARSVAAAAASGGIAAKGMSEGGDKDKDKMGGGGLLAGKKRARLLPERTFEKVTPEAGEKTRHVRFAVAGLSSDPFAGQPCSAPTFCIESSMGRKTYDGGEVQTASPIAVHQGAYILVSVFLVILVFFATKQQCWRKRRRAAFAR